MSLTIVISKIVNGTGIKIEPGVIGEHRYEIKGPIGNPPIFVIVEGERVLDYRKNETDAITRAHQFAVGYVKEFQAAFREKNYVMLDKTGLENKTDENKQ